MTSFHGLLPGRDAPAAYQSTPSGIKWQCSNGISPHCSRGTGKTMPKKCAHCGSSIRVDEGWFGVFEHRADGRYPKSEAHALYTTEKRAEKAVKGTSLVIRFVR